MNTIIINITDYLGSIGAEHYYAKKIKKRQFLDTIIKRLKNDEAVVNIREGEEIEQPITLARAKTLDAKYSDNTYLNEKMWLRAQERGKLYKHIAFDSIQEIIDFCMKEYKKESLDKSILFLYHGELFNGSVYCESPNKNIKKVE